MEVVITTPGQAANLVADAITAMVARRPDAVLGVATGSSPRRVVMLRHILRTVGPAPGSPCRR